MIREASQRQSEQMVKKQLGVARWVHDVDYLESLELLASQPTINIGYTGPGGKTVLPHRAVAKIDMRLVPEMTAMGINPIVWLRQAGSWPGYVFTNEPLKLAAVQDRRATTGAAKSQIDYLHQLAVT